MNNVPKLKKTCKISHKFCKALKKVVIMLNKTKVKIKIWKNKSNLQEYKRKRIN